MPDAPMSSAHMPGAPMLDVRDLSVSYGTIRAVRGISLSVGKGELVSLLGANGAGKSSTIKCIAGALKASGGAITLDGRDITNASPEQVVRAGLATVPETRDVFPDLTVAENLMLGAYIHRRDGAGNRANLERLHVLASGRTIAEGAAEDVRKNPAVIEAYLGSGASRA